MQEKLQDRNFPFEGLALLFHSSGLVLAGCLLRGHPGQVDGFPFVGRRPAEAVRIKAGLADRGHTDLVRLVTAEAVVPRTVLAHQEGDMSATIAADGNDAGVCGA